MNATDLATKLDAREYPLDRIDGYRSLMAEAKQNGLLVIYGASDDLMEFDGLFRDEVGVYGSKDVVIDETGVMPDRDDIDTDEDMARYLQRKRNGSVVRAVWDRGDGVSWCYETALPHATFRIVEDAEVYCVGLVIERAALASPHSPLQDDADAPVPDNAGAPAPRCAFDRDGEVNHG